MRKRIVKNGLVVNAIAGTHVVFFGLNLEKSKRPGFLGFGFRRFEAATGEIVWLKGMKTFKEIEPHPVPGELFRSNEHPFQSFQWADYSVKPGQEYRYTVITLYGNPGALKTKNEIEIEVVTEIEAGPKHSVFFNRGSVASQEYARRFQNKRPSQAGIGSYEWLSRGLVEALISFIGRATSGWEIHAAVYEFQWAALLEDSSIGEIASSLEHLDVLKAIKAAHNRGAVVKVVYDDIGGDNPKSKGPAKNNRSAISAAKIKNLCKGRSNSSKIMHNKFFVLSNGGIPKAVWTGSTNLTENGIFGHSNLGHVVEDEAVAKTFLEYWNRLNDDPAVDGRYRDSNSVATPIPQANFSNGTIPIFSPRGSNSNLDSLDWYAQIAGQAKNGLFMTFAFGMHEKFKEVYRKDDAVLRMALLEKEGNSPKTADQDKKDILKIRARPNVVMAIGNRIKTNSFDNWLAEMDKISNHVHVYWIHTKYMLVDPLGANPIVVSGSANFSKASTIDNDENMLVIKGDKRIADVYFGEYMRLYTHYAFREAVKFASEKTKKTRPGQWTPNYLVDNDTWMESYFDPQDTSGRFARREYFAGPMVE